MSSKKKWLIGCGIFVLLVILSVVGVIGFATYKLASFGNALKSGVARVEQTNTSHPFKRPAGDVLDPERMKAYLAVRESIAATIMAHPVLKKIQANDPKNPPGALELVSAVMDFMKNGIYEYAAQLDKNNMSLNEYRYYSMMTYLTVMDGADAGDPDLSPIAMKWDRETQAMNAEMAKNPNMRGISIDPDSVKDSLNGVAEPLPAENRATVAAYKDTLEKNSFATFLEVIGGMMIDAKTAEMKRQGSPVNVMPMPTPVPLADGLSESRGATSEGETFDVFLSRVGDKKVSVIVEVRSATGLGLKEAKDLVEKAPTVVGSGLSQEEATRFKSALEAAGATVELKPAE